MKHKASRIRLMELAGLVNEATIPFPTWYNSFIEKLAVKLSERITGLDSSDLKFEIF